MGDFSAVLKLDNAVFNNSLTVFARYSKRGGQEILFEEAKNFVRRVISVTPPSKGKASTEARKHGEAAIAADLSRVLSPAPQGFIDHFVDFWGGREAKEMFGHKGAAALGFIYTRALEKDELTDWHQSRRRKDGRVMDINRNVTTGLRKRDLRGLDMGLVETGTYEWFKKRVQRRVGLLASGWNRSAERLGYKPPAWIRRHGTDRGGAEITLGNGVFRVRITNDVPFADSVKGLQRSVQSALNMQGQAMDRRVAYFIEKAGKSSGFK